MGATAVREAGPRAAQVPLGSDEPDDGEVR